MKERRKGMRSADVWDTRSKILLEKFNEVVLHMRLGELAQPVGAKKAPGSESQRFVPD